MLGAIVFDVRPNGRVFVEETPGVGELAVFTENFLLNRRNLEVPGIVTFTTLTPGSIIRVTPSQGAALTYRIDSIDDWAPARDGTIHTGFNAPVTRINPETSLDEPTGFAGRIIKTTRLT